MDTRTPAIPLKQQEKSHHLKKERVDVSLPPLTPFVQQRQRARSLPGGFSKQHSHVLPNQQSQKRHPYRVLQIGATPLMHACQQADRSRVLKLLKTQEETIGYRDRTLRSALHYCMDAATGGAVAAAAPELVNAPDAEGHTPLHLAVIAGDTQLVAVLLANGADVNARDIEGHSVLHWATVCGEVECVRLLLSAGAKPSIPDLRGGSPLHYAAQCCGVAATAELTIPKKISLKVLQILLEFGANVNARDEDGRQPILWAASAGSVDAVLALSRAGGLAVAGSSDKDGLTALHCAASRGHARCVEALVNLCGAQPDHVDDNGCSALHYSATLGHADATALLLKLGADPNRQDRKGRTPAICAAAKGQLETLKILAQHGGSLHARTVRGTGIGHEAVASGRIELVKWLVKKRPNLLDVATQDGKTPLHVAALHGHLDVCKLLLDNSARINAILRTGKGSLMTALDAALYRGHRDCAKLIQMHGGSTAQQIRMHKNVPCKVFSARLRLRNSESSSDSDSPRRIRRHKPELYYEEHWMEKRMRKRSNGKKLSRQDSRSFSEEELRIMKETKKKDLHRRSHSESRRYNDDLSSEELLKKCNRSSKKCIKYNSSSLDSESDEENRRSRSKNGKSQVVTVSKREEYEELLDGSVSEDSLEVIVRTKSMEKYEKVVSGRRHKIPWERSEKKFSRKKTVRKGIEYEEEVSDKEMTVDSNRRKSKEAEERYDQETDSTSQEMGEKVTVTAIIHKDQVPDTPKDDTQDETCKDESPRQLDNIMDQSAEEYPSSLINKAADMKKDVEEMRQQTVLKQQEDSNERSALARRRTSIKESDIEAFKSLVQEEDNKEGQNSCQKEDKTPPTPARRRSSIREKDIEAIKQVAMKNDEKAEGNKYSSRRRSSIKDLESMKSLKDDRKLSIFTPAEQEEQRRRSQEKEQLLQVINDETEEISSGEPEQSDQQVNEKPDDKQHSDSNVRNEDNLKSRSRRNSLMSVPSDKKSPRSPRGKNQSENADGEEEFEKDQSFQVLDMKTDTETMRKMSMRIADDEEESKIKMDENEAETKCEEQKEIDESSSSSPAPPKSAKSRPSTGKSKRRPPSSKQTLFESSEEQSPDRSAIVAVIESPEWDDQEELEKEAIVEEQIDHDGVAKVLPSTSEEETPRLSGTFKPAMSDAIIQVETKPSVRIVGPDCAGESQDRTKLNQRRDSGGRDSGIEPSPRASRIPRRTMNCCPNTQKQQQLRMDTVTRDVQISLRRYHLERRIFFQLMELKRLQIRHGRTNEHVLVKRQVDTFNKSGMTGPLLGVVKYDHQPLTFRHFEKFLYEQLRKLQKRPATPDWCTEARQCTKKTHQCHHATSAYTSVPIYTYLGGSVPDRGTGLLPKIESRGSGHMTVEVTHGEEKRVIALPAEKLNPNKRYFFTFTVKGDAEEVDVDEPTDGAQANPKSD